MIMSKNVQEAINALNDTLTYYCINVDTSEDQPYTIFNKQLGVVEYASELLPGVIFQAEHLDNMLASLIEDEDAGQKLALAELPTDDVVPN